MMIDGGYKLAHYANGLATLCDRVTDPAEQSNLFDSRDAEDVVSRLDAAITRELLGALFDGNVEKGYDYATLIPNRPSERSSPSDSGALSTLTGSATATERIDVAILSAFDRHPIHEAETRSVIVSHA